MHARLPQILELFDNTLTTSPCTPACLLPPTLIGEESCGRARFFFCEEVPPLIVNESCAPWLPRFGVSECNYRKPKGSRMRQNTLQLSSGRNKPPPVYLSVGLRTVGGDDVGLSSGPATRPHPFPTGRPCGMDGVPISGKFHIFRSAWVLPCLKHTDVFFSCVRPQSPDPGENSAQQKSCLAPLSFQVCKWQTRPFVACMDTHHQVHKCAGIFHKNRPDGLLGRAWSLSSVACSLPARGSKSERDSSGARELACIVRARWDLESELRRLPILHHVHSTMRFIYFGFPASKTGCKYSFALSCAPVAALAWPRAGVCFSPNTRSTRPCSRVSHPSRSFRRRINSMYHVV